MRLKDDNKTTVTVILLSSLAGITILGIVIYLVINNKNEKVN